MSTIAAAALDMQVDLLRFVNSPTGHDLTSSMARAVHGDGQIPQGDLERYAIVTHRAQATPLSIGETFAVSTEIHEIVDSASETLPEFTMHESDVPSPQGFMWLETPVLIKDHGGKMIVVKAISWTAAITESNGTDETITGILMIPWTDPRDPRDHMNVDVGVMNLLSERPPLAFLGMSIHMWDQPIGDDGPDPFKTKMLRYLYTLWRFMGETWIDGRAVMPDRPAMKRAIRAGRPTQEVRVIRLRKREQSRNPDADPLDDDDILWSHRWLVKGHWRNQFYPSQARHAPRWISGYVKGPEHLPLIVKDTVFVVDR